MQLNRYTTIDSILRSHPDAVSVLAWYGVSVSTSDCDAPLWQVASFFRLDIDEVLANLASIVPTQDDDDNQYLALHDHDGIYITDDFIDFSLEQDDCAVRAR